MILNTHGNESKNYIHVKSKNSPEQRIFKTRNQKLRKNNITIDVKPNKRISIDQIEGLECQKIIPTPV